MRGSLSILNGGGTTIAASRRLILLGVSFVLVFGVSLMVGNDQRKLAGVPVYKGDERYNSSSAVRTKKYSKELDEMEGTEDDEYGDDDTDGTTTRHRKRWYKNATYFSCTWAPEMDDACVEHLSDQLGASLLRPDADGKNNDDDGEDDYKRHSLPLRGRRWAFLGDSTMAMMWRLSPLQVNLTREAAIRRDCPNEYNCSVTFADRCGVNEALQVSRATEWTRPNFSRAEGPVQNGLANPFCYDCMGCNPVTLTCHDKEHVQHGSNASTSTTQCGLRDRNTVQAIYGGFLGVEFARDVEFPSLEYSTTQETIVRGYLARQWNTPRQLADFGRPICVVIAGFHDATIPNITQALYMANVAWYIDLLLDHACAHVVWIGNTCPGTDKYAQKRLMIYQWNYAVRDYLWRHREDRTSYIDVYNASITYARNDNVHMSPTWYNLLGSMFVKIFASN